MPAFRENIGDTNLAINPLNDNVPYSDASQVANTNISLVLNGPSGGTGTNTLTLAPVSALSNGNEYTGTTTINNNAALVLGRTIFFVFAFILSAVLFSSQARASSQKTSGQNI